MLKLVTGNLGYEFSNGTNVLFFPLKIIHTRNITIDDQCTLINAYIKYKGKEWYDKLFNYLKEVHDEISFSVSNKQLVPIESMKVLINYLDVIDIENFLVNVFKLKPPKDLVSEFTDDMRRDGRWNEEQTYTIGDYMKLSAEIIRLKFLLGPICYYGYLNYSKINKDLVEYTSIRILIPEILNTSVALKRVTDMITKLIKVADMQIVIIEKKLPEDELGKYVTYITLIQRIATATLVNDNENKNIIIYIYGYSTSKLSNSGDVSKMTRAKLSVSNDDNSASDSASIMESYKTVTVTTQGDVMNAVWATENIESNLHNSPNIIGNTVNVNEVNSILNILIKYFEEPLVSNFTERMCKFLFGNTINQRAVNVIPIENMLVCMAIGYCFLKNAGYENLAELLISKEVEFTEISYNPKDKKDKQLASKVNAIFFDEGDKLLEDFMGDLVTSNWVNYNGSVEVAKSVINDLARLFIEFKPELYKIGE